MSESSLGFLIGLACAFLVVSTLCAAVLGIEAWRFLRGAQGVLPLLREFLGEGRKAFARANRLAEGGERVAQTLEETVDAVCGQVRDSLSPVRFLGEWFMGWLADRLTTEPHTRGYSRVRHKKRKGNGNGRSSEEV